MQSKEQILKEYGLSDNKIKVYLANLRLGTAKANVIAKTASLLRTTAYEVLKSLAEVGLVSQVIKSGVIHFEATEPSKLVSILEEKKRKIKTILPDLEILRKSIKEKPGVHLYEGKPGLKSILDDIINSNPKEILQLNSAKIFTTLRFYFPHWIKRRVKHKIKARILQQKVKIVEEYKETDKLELREIRFLPKNFKINTANFIYKNKIAILTMKEDEIIGVIIESRDIVETQRSLFEFLWRMSK